MTDSADKKKIHIEANRNKHTYSQPHHRFRIPKGLDGNTYFRLMIETTDFDLVLIISFRGTESGMETLCK